MGLEQKPGPGLGAAMNLLMSEGGGCKKMLSMRQGF